LVLFAILCSGILAAIAIPNFLRYQLRAKESELKVEIRALVQAEEAHFQRNGRYVAVGPLPAGTPGSQKMPLSAQDLKLATDIDWMVGASTYGQYAVSVARDGQAASVCAEADIDADGVRSVQVAFLPGPEGAETPPAPCTEPVPYSPQYPPGEPVVLSGPNVF
jgi:type IV pilus assembly protein PilA